MTTRFVIGIDLGTTNSALAYADTGAGGEPKVRPFPVPQVVGPGAVEERTLLPSFLYLPGAGEQPAGALKLPWDADRDYCVGEFARAFGAKVPTRLVASAKSWLCHPGVDRKAPILPFRAAETDRRVSPLDACVALPQAPRRGVEPHDGEGRARTPAGAAGHRADGPGVVRRRGAGTDGRSGPRRRVRAPDAAGGAAGRVLRVARQPRREVAQARCRSATWCWSRTSAAAPPTSR